MKTRKTISFFVLAFCFGVINAQYSVLLNFDGPTFPDGEAPEGSLTLSNGKLYGMTYYGGPHSNGNIFSIDTNGNNYKDLFDFNGTNGAYPQGDLTISGNKLYGMTNTGGIYGVGNIFSIDTNGNGFTNLYSFNGGNNYPTSSLTLLGNRLYGMTQGGGINSDGCIFSIDTDGNGYRELLDFDITNGAAPLGDLTQNRNKFYGMTRYGGALKCGVVFSIDTNGNNYKTLLNFDTINGSYPGGNLTIFGRKLYGMTDEGGIYDSGCIFSMDTNGNGYKHLFDFNRTNGVHPGLSSLTLVGGNLYGTTSIGGLNGDGIIFSMDTNGTSYTDIFNFDITNGVYPSGVIANGNILYGMATFGGAFSEGVIFNFKQVGLEVTTLTAENIGDIKVYPNPSNGQFTFSFNQPITGTIEVYDITGREVYQQAIQSEKTEINLATQPAGIFFYRVINNIGFLIGEGKIVVEK